MRRLTVKDLKEAVNVLPDDTIVCCYSDSEGNAQSTALEMYVDVVGKVHKVPDGHDNEILFVGGEEIIGIDREKDKGKHILIIVPSL